MTFIRSKHDINQYTAADTNRNSVATRDVWEAASAACYSKGIAIVQSRRSLGMLVRDQRYSAGITPPGSTLPTGWSHWFFVAQVETPSAHIMSYPFEHVSQKLYVGEWMPTEWQNF
jgi:hypothetical protein